MPKSKREKANEARKNAEAQLLYIGIF